MSIKQRIVPFPIMQFYDVNVAPGLFASSPFMLIWGWLKIPTPKNDGQIYFKTMSRAI
jgi:hypothetical protein